MRVWLIDRYGVYKDIPMTDLPSSELVAIVSEGVDPGPGVEDNPSCDPVEQARIILMARALGI